MKSKLPPLHNGGPPPPHLDKTLQAGERATLTALEDTVRTLMEERDALKDEVTTRRAAMEEMEAKISELQGGGGKKKKKPASGGGGSSGSSASSSSRCSIM